MHISTYGICTWKTLNFHVNVFTVQPNYGLINETIIQRMHQTLFQGTLQNKLDLIITQIH